jgi:hypothetical protein
MANHDAALYCRIDELSGTSASCLQSQRLLAISNAAALGQKTLLDQNIHRR